MGGGAVVSTGNKGRKALDAAINLVPFIDLLSCCLSFLLITAVWSQLAQLPATHGGSGATGDHDPNDFSLTLSVHKESFLLETSNGAAELIDSRGERSDLAQLALAMSRIKQANPTKSDVTVHADDIVAFERLVSTMDVLRAADFPAIHVSSSH